MLIRIEIEAYLHLPEGTQVPNDGRAFTLPSGNWVKPFVVLEMDDGRDLSFTEANALGIDLEEANIQWFEVEGEEA